MKWSIGDIVFVSGWQDHIAAAGVIVGIPPCPKEEEEKYFGVRNLTDLLDHSVSPPHVSRQIGEEYNAHYNQLLKPSEAVYIAELFASSQGTLHLDD